MLKKISFAAVICFVSVSFAANYEMTHTEKPVVIDGKLNDPCWQEAMIADGFLDFSTRNEKHRKVIEEMTEAMVCRDGNHLYIAAICFVAQGNKILDYIADHDGDVWQNDSFEIFLCPDAGDRSRTYQIIVNSKGTVYDAYMDDNLLTAKQKDTSWSSHAKVKTIVNSTWWADETFWVLEMQLPLESLPLLNNDNRWAINFAREHVYEGTEKRISTWSPIKTTKLSPMHYRPGYNTAVVLEKGIKPSSTRVHSIDTRSLLENSHFEYLEYCNTV